VDFRIVAACRNGTLCTLKRGWSTARTVAVLESQVSPLMTSHLELVGEKKKFVNQDLSTKNILIEILKFNLK
jgi:hypothetical protein